MSPKNSKATAPTVEAPAESGDVEPSEATSATGEAEAVESESLTCGPVRLSKQGKGYGWAESQHAATPHAVVRVTVGPHGYVAAAALGGAGIARSKGTHPQPEQAAAELEANINSALEAVRRKQATAASRVQDRRLSSQQAALNVAQADRDLVTFCRKVAWPGVDAA